MSEIAVETSTSIPANTVQEWSVTRRVSLRFVWAYVALYFFPSALDSFVPFIETPFGRWQGRMWEPFVRFVGGRMLGLTGELGPTDTGSGDTTFDYVNLLGVVTGAILVTAIWSAVDRRRKEYETAEEALRVTVRYVLAFIMLGYGIAKVFKTQFPFPGPDRLLQPYGQSSPMGLLWTFMGVSAPYTIFGGALEVLGGFLLFFRRTTTLGALVIAGVMSNVVMLNFCYDVPVKIFSTHLFLCALFLASKDAQRLLAVLVFNRPTEALPERKRLPKRWMEKALPVAKWLWLGSLIYGSISSGVESARKYGPLAQRPALYGAYDVVEHERDGKNLPPLVTDETRYRYATVNQWGMIRLLTMTNTRVQYKLNVDQAKKTLTLTPFEKETPMVLSFEQPDENRIVVTGTLEGSAIRLELRKIDESKMPLVGRGFHWVNEQPFNR